MMGHHRVEKNVELSSLTDPPDPPDPPVFCSEVRSNAQ